MENIHYKDSKENEIENYFYLAIDDGKTEKEIKEKDKEITVFDVLGKKVLQTVLSSKELNISSLTPGVYIIQIKEEEATATRKLIVK